MFRWLRDWRPPWWTPEQFYRAAPGPNGEVRWTYVPAGVPAVTS